ncbi:discoidin domain-containing protein [Polaribacter batillariae]|uniref:Discoidin domain-containing protein n=1 Tax=Polaribacter batillariae TaxID=2808900 RepID=A0ABX7SUJ2_9FLAO|nr:discoidin domain-containing protein [Polaribacter batillariae]QTD37841.1 discoidin domain-containing protein [Polaribacter batillariae]
MNTNREKNVLFKKIIQLKKSIFLLLILISANNYSQSPTFAGSRSNCRNAAGAPITVAVPPGSANDLLIASVNASDNTSRFLNITAPSGWTLLRTGNSGDGTTTLAVFYKIATNAEPTSYSFSVDFSNRLCASIVRYDNVANLDTTPIYVSAISTSPSSFSSPVSPSVYAPIGENIILRIVGVDNDYTLTRPSGTTQRININNFFTTQGIAERYQPTAGNSGTATWTYGRNGRRGGWVSVTLAFSSKELVDPCDAVASGNLDTDNDGISDICDLDDDNDGILDTVESNPNFIGGTATQSSSLGNRTCPNNSCSASLARDGNTSGNFSSGSVTHTNTQNNPWWLLDMEVDTTISTVVIHNRTDCCGNRLDNFILEVLDTNNNVVYTHNNGSAAAVNTINGINTLGRKIRIRLVGSNRVLSLAEVVVQLANALDIDRDGIPNSRDLDSDNDGCPDATEAATPSILKSSGNNANDGIANNTPNAAIDTAQDPVGSNGLANSLENTDTNTAINTNAFSTTNYRNYALNNSKNGCGNPMITQIYWKGTEKIIEVTNRDASKIVVPNAANLNLFNNGVTAVRTATASNTEEILAGESVLFTASATMVAPIKTETPVVVTPSVIAFDNSNDILTISSNGKANNNFAWRTRKDAIQNLTDNTSLVRIDEILQPTNAYNPNEWTVFIDDAIATTFNNFLRHPHSAVLSEITTPVPTESNTLLGLHRFGKTTRIGNTWSNGTPDKSRFVAINENYMHSGKKLIARKLEVQENRILSLDNQVLIVTDNLHIADAAEIRLIGTSQLIQTHPGTANATGNGKLYIDQNSDLASVYRFNYLGAPVTSLGALNYTVESVLKDGTNPLSHTGIVGQSSTNIARNINFVGGLDGSSGTPINISEKWIYTFASAEGKGANWVWKGKNGTIAPTDGFILKGTEVAQNYTFVGNPNDGELRTAVGASESYLLGNPYPSALNGLKFIQDNINSIDGTLYFWDHVGEESTAEATDGHLYNGYIGGYATLNLSMAVAAVSKPLVGAFNIKLEAENTVTNGTNTTEGTRNIITLNNNLGFIKINAITRATDKIELTYTAPTEKLLRFVVDGKARKTYTLPASANYTTFTINECVTVGASVRFESLDRNSISIDYLTISDDDGNISCAPAPGTDASLYKTPGTYIPVGQGFFISGDTDGGPIVFNNNQRQFVTENSGNAVFFKTNKKTKKSIDDDMGDFNKLPFIKLGMDFVNTERESLHRQIGVSFSANNTFQFEKGYDSPVNDLGETDIYWKFPENDHKYVIAGIGNVSYDLEIPFEITMDYDGTNILKIDDSFAIEADIFLKDKLKNKNYLLKNKEVALQLKKGTHKNRFAIVFEESKIIEEVQNPTEEKEKEITVFLDAQNSALMLQNKGEILIEKVTLYNLLGQKIQSWENLEKTTEYSLKIKNFPENIYIVNVKTEEGKISKKIIFEK